METVQQEGQQVGSSKVFTFEGKQGAAMKALVVIGGGALAYGAAKGVGRLVGAYRTAKAKMAMKETLVAAKEETVVSPAAPAAEGDEVPHAGNGPATAAASAAAKKK